MYAISNKIALLSIFLLLTACGQSGELQLPNDPNYDKRAQYLLYPNTDSQATSADKKVVATLDAPAASQVTTN
ncbi:MULTISPECIES: lipoprotein [Acinetobacter]|uniref:Lipoprotein n=1 Tax=Acinetobacter piscicola TaxID=2006115 RepID=A0A4V1W1W8_9GAMM|nr:MULTISPECIES: lipoprotein [Acinetobacter]MDM1756114.1 lipoprotein [Acinetobacter sp. 256-1]MDM1760445.1 lipoprotein [Acinetobacter sp. 251-1]QOW45373.1 lipoprotein [Acinetobacter piscicola]RYL28578.1 hypothetical protein EWP19_04370 [Acinetobacter piscicola]